MLPVRASRLQINPSVPTLQTDSWALQVPAWAAAGRDELGGAVFSLPLPQPRPCRTPGFRGWQFPSVTSGLLQRSAPAEQANVLGHFEAHAESWSLPVDAVPLHPMTTL